MKKILSIFLWLFWILSFIAINLNFVNAQARGKNSSSDAPADVGIHFNQNCLTWVGEWCFHYEKMLWIADNQPGSGYTATSIAQDIVLSATYAVWTVLTAVIIWCGLWYILSSASDGKTQAYSNWLKYAAIWACLVWWAYAIVRLIQYIAQW